MDTNNAGTATPQEIDWADVRQNPQNYPATMVLRDVMFGRPAFTQQVIAKAIAEIEAGKPDV